MKITMGKDGYMYLKVVSPETGRSHIMGRKPSKETPRAKLKEELELEAKQFLSREETLAKYFTVKVKKIAISRDDVRHLTSIDTQNLLEKVDMGLLVVQASMEGIPPRSGEETREAYAKRALISLFEKDPDFDINTLLGDAGELKVRPDMKDQIVDKRGDFVVFKDGTYFSYAQKSTKTVEYLKSKIDDLTIDDCAAIRDYLELVKKFKKILRASDAEGTIPHILDKMFVRDLPYDLTPGNERGLAVRLYVNSLLDEDFDSAKEADNFLNGHLDSFFESGLDDGFVVDSQVLSPAARMAALDTIQRFVEEPREVGGLRNKNEIMGRALEIDGEWERLAAFDASIKERITEHLKGKPLTERRILAAYEEIVEQERAKFSFVAIQEYPHFRRFLRKLFASEMERASEEAAEKEKKRAERAETKFNWKTIKNPERAATELLNRWEGLSDEARLHLGLAAIKGAPCPLDDAFLEDVEKLVWLMKKAGREVMASKVSRELILHALVEMGSADLADWSWIGPAVAAKIADRCPREKVADALSALIRFRDVSVAVDKLLGLHAGELPLDLAEAIIEKALGDEELLGAISLRHVNKIAKGPGFKRIVRYVKFKQAEAAGDVDLKTFDPKTPEEGLYFFNQAHEAGEKSEAVRFLKVALQGKESLPWALRQRAGFTDREAILKSEEVAADPRYASAIVSSLAKNPQAFSWLSFRHVDAILTGAGLGEKEKATYSAETFGKDHEYSLAYAKAVGEVDSEAIVDKIVAEFRDKERMNGRGYRNEYMFRIPSHLQDFTGEIVARFSPAATIENISHISRDLLSSMPDKARRQFAWLAEKVLERDFSHHASAARLERYFLIFRDDPDLSARVASAIAKPWQVAVACRTLSREAILGLRAHLVKLAEKNEESLAALAAVSGLEDLPASARERLVNLPSYIRDLVYAQNLSEISDSQWETLLSSDPAFSWLEAAIKRHGGDYGRDLVDLIQTFDGHEKALYNIALFSSSEGLREVVLEKMSDTALRDTLEKATPHERETWYKRYAREIAPYLGESQLGVVREVMADTMRQYFENGDVYRFEIPQFLSTAKTLGVFEAVRRIFEGALAKLSDEELVSEIKEEIARQAA